MIETRYLIFEQIVDSKIKTKYFGVKSKKGDFLGTIYFKSQWRKYIFQPFDRTIYDFSCLIDIAVFIDEQTISWREELKTRK